MSQTEPEDSTPQKPRSAPASSPCPDAPQGTETTSKDGVTEQPAVTEAERRYHRLTGTVFMLFDDTK